MPTAGRGTTGNLPAELTSFVGRRRDVGEVRRLLTKSRLVTLTGIGGSGKTRLAVRVAAEVRRTFPDGAWFVDLTRLPGAGPLTADPQGPEVLAHLVTATVGLRRPHDRPALPALVEQLAGRRQMLILDNCEHVLPACATVAEVLLRGCPELRVVATSREPLAITGESLFPVPPLPYPEPGDQPGPADLRRYESVALFLARAEAAVPGFTLSEDHLVAVADLCRRLDGSPLAIELAAARVRVLVPPQILDRMADRFALLSRGSRSTPERQRTLRACVDWSFDLCTAAERLLWARLSVFAGGFELDAVEGVHTVGELPGAELLDLMTGLVDKSILVRDDAQGGPAETARYRMQETIRDYGQDRLRAEGKDAVLRRRHRDWYQRLVDRAAGEWVGDRQAYWTARLAREWPNLRAAVEFCLSEPGEAEGALRLAVALPQSYWRAGGVTGEGRRWLESALSQVSAPTVLRARALLVAGQLAFTQGDLAAGMRLLDEGEELARRLADCEAGAHAVFVRGLGALHANDLPAAVDTLEESRRILAAAPDENLDRYLTVLVTLAVAAGLAGSHERAGAGVRELLAIVEPRGEGIHRSLALWADGLIAWLRGDLRRAAAREVASLRVSRAGEGDRHGAALALETLAWITAGQQRHRRAAALLGAADAIWTGAGAPLTGAGHLVSCHDTCARQIRGALGDATFADAFHGGQAMGYEDAITYALNEPRQPAPARPEHAPVPLTRRERQVADLIAQGLSNKDIAASLVVSQRTAESHAQHILTKLGFSSRAQVAAWITDHATATA
jgi:predicted ATPase/DNA-binding CsgD family transcriptional regulator